MNNIDQSKKDFLLKESKTFCMMPWVHLFATPKGSVYPCCSHNNLPPIGDTKKNSIAEISNVKELKQLRLDMLNEIPNDTCGLCYKLQNVGSHNLRTWSIEKFSKFFDEVVPTTQADGTVDDLKLRYFDIRFNNICNFKCRTCGGEYSSQWAIEDYTWRKKLNRLSDDKNWTILEADGTGKLLEEVLSHIDNMEIAYFAGGEPMLSDEHYIILESMIKKGKTDIKLRYNTNASTLKFKDKDVLDLWKHFKHIEVSSSIDHYGERAEYIRHGTNWGEVENNLRMFRNLPNIIFQISTVLSNLNFLTIVDLFSYLKENDFYRRDDFLHYMTATSSPSYFSATSLPVDLKHIGLEKISKYFQNYRGDTPTLDNNLDIAVTHVKSADTWEENKEMFQAITNETDIRRGESLLKVFPELAPLME